MSSEINKITKDLTNPEHNVDIIGNLYICNELCNLVFNYKENKDINNLHIIHNKNSILLEIKYNGKSSINYNGGENFGSKEIKFNLTKILLIGPSKHFIKNHRHTMELILVHQSEDGKTFQNICVLLEISDNKEYQKKLQYQLLMDIAENIPTKITNSKKVNTNYTWSAEDLLPENKSFYTYNSPFDSNVNWVIFNNIIYAPSLLLDNYQKYVVNPVKNAKGEVGEKIKKFLNPPIPNNPKNLILFSHQIITGITSSCAQKLADEYNKNTDDKNTDDKNSDDKNSGDKNNNEEEDDEEDEKKEKSKLSGLKGEMHGFGSAEKARLEELKKKSFLSEYEKKEKSELSEKKRKIDDKDSSDKDGSNKNILSYFFMFVVVGVISVSLCVFIYKIDYIWEYIKSIFGKVKNSISSKSSGTSESLELQSLSGNGATNNVGNNAITGATNNVGTGATTNAGTNATNVGTNATNVGTNVGNGAGNNAKRASGLNLFEQSKS